MKNVISFLLILLIGSPVFGQHNSSDFKDAATTGPFPLYLAVGFANSFTNSDFKDVGREFLRTTSRAEAKNRLYGLHVVAGATLAREEWTATLVAEVKHLLLARFQRAYNDNFFVMRINMTSFGVGGRIAAYPFVFQAQAGPILRYSRNYDFKLTTGKKRLTHEQSFPGIAGLIRISILDPAGTEGGPGMYVEGGFNYIWEERNNELGDAIRQFKSTYVGTDEEAKRRFGYLSFGFILPIAIRIK